MLKQLFGIFLWLFKEDLFIHFKGRVTYRGWDSFHLLVHLQNDCSGLNCISLKPGSKTLLWHSQTHARVQSGVTFTGTLAGSCAGSRAARTWLRPHEKPSSQEVAFLLCHNVNHISVGWPYLHFINFWWISESRSKWM